MSFEARCAGTCTDCTGAIHVGQTIKKAGGRRYAHVDCDEVGFGGVNEHKARTGRCEDAPCCGCCGGWQEAESSAFMIGYQ
jgi:hypothetical protein